jgi:hypothetical protein
VDKSVIANTIAPNSATLPPTLSAVFVAMLAIWHVIVLIVSVALTGATTVATAAVALNVLLAVAMLLIVRWR